MSLVAYAASSDEDSDCTDEEVYTSNSINIVGTGSEVPTANGSISDDEDYAPTEFSSFSKQVFKLSSLALPKPIYNSDSKDTEVLEEVKPVFSKLPIPKHNVESNVVEEDDEFLHKKAILPSEEVKPKPPANVTPIKGPVKITIPSLKDFSDVERDMASKTRDKPLQGQNKSSLLSILPQAKSEQNFSKAVITSKEVNNKFIKSSESVKSVNLFIPDTVKNCRPAHNTEGVDGIKKSSKKSSSNNAKPKLSLVACSDSDESDNEGDFFSLNSKNNLPNVSENEINAMIVQRAAKMANATTQYLKTAEEQKQATEECIEIENQRLLGEKHQQQIVLDQKAMHALAGSRAKRRKKDKHIEVVDISSAEVLPSREEWMRTALASSTAYQPTGVLVDEEPAAGTRRKHQITYLAHKAKANEAELQAMWSANRQNRRATQSKYGF